MSMEAILESLFHTAAYPNEMLPFPTQENCETLALAQKSILGTTNISNRGSLVWGYSGDFN